MARIEGRIRIERSIEEVFDFVSDQRNEPRYNREMISAEKVTEGAIGPGTLYRAVMRSGPRTFPMSIAVTTFERPRRLGSHAEMDGMCTDGELVFEPVGASTMMSWSWDIRPTGALALLGPLVTLMGRRQELRIWTSLKHLLEAGG